MRSSSRASGVDDNLMGGAERHPKGWESGTIFELGLFRTPPELRNLSSSCHEWAKADGNRHVHGSRRYKQQGLRANQIRIGCKFRCHGNDCLEQRAGRKHSLRVVPLLEHRRRSTQVPI